MSASWRNVISFPFGTPLTYLSIGSSRDTFPSPASCISSAAVKVLVREPMRWYMSVVIGVFDALSATPTALTYLP